MGARNHYSTLNIDIMFSGIVLWMNLKQFSQLLSFLTREEGKSSLWNYLRISTLIMACL